MGDVIHASFAQLPRDGGKARMRRRREHRLAISAREILAGISPVEMCFPRLDDLTMDHADPAYAAQQSNPA